MIPELELFWISGSPPSWRVMLVLEVKALPYHSRRLDAGKHEHKTPHFLAINPRGQVPVLRAGEEVIRESLAIIAFLDRLRPDPPLFGRDALRMAGIWQRIFDFENHMRPAITTIARILFRDRQHSEATELAGAITAVSEELTDWEKALAKRGPFLYGDTPTAADLILHPGLQWLERALERAEGDNACISLRDRLGTSVPLQNLRSAIEALPGYERTYPPHWREG